MDNATTPRVDFCLECEFDGSIISVIRSDIAFPYSIEQPIYLQHTVMPASIDKVEQLLAQVQQEGICIDWEIQVPYPPESIWMLASAFRVQNAVIVIASSRKVTHDQSMFEEIMRINNEQNSEIRRLQKELLEMRRQLQRCRESI